MRGNMDRHGKGRKTKWQLAATALVMLAAVLSLFVVAPSFIAKTNAAGTSYTLRFRIVGTTLYAKAWQTGSSEPANWMVTATDSSLSSGYCGLRMQVQSSTTINISSFQATAQ